MISVIVTGISGRMGSRIADLLKDSPGLKLNGATETPGSFAIGTSISEGHQVVDDLSKCIQNGEVIIDFSSPEATLKHAKIAAEHKKALVIGTTGFSSKQKSELKEILYTIPSVWAPNMSIGVNVLFKVAAQTAKLLGESYDIEIIEAHHRHKKDAPSGTALGLAESIASAMQRELSQVACYERHGQIGARPKQEIGIQTIRGGDIVGDHTAIFAGEGERLELTHRANNRDNFARGAILAAKWVTQQSAGIYDMQDVLSLRD